MSGFRDPAEYVARAKHRWAGHIVKRTDDTWTERILEWKPREIKRPRGRPPKRWADVFVEKLDQLSNQLDTVLEDGIDSREGLRAKSNSPAFLDDASERTKRMEEMLGPARFVKTGHLSI